MDPPSFSMVNHYSQRWESPPMSHNQLALVLAQAIRRALPETPPDHAPEPTQPRSTDAVGARMAPYLKDWVMAATFKTARHFAALPPDTKP
jgi:hypothetical protein